LLELDCVLPGVVQWLDAWRNAVHFVLVTVRSNAQAVREQLGRLDLLRYFTDVIVVSHRSASNNIKAIAARKHIIDRPVAWVGDTELDIEAAREIGARPIGVTSGIRTAERLRQAGAADIVDCVTAIRIWPAVSVCAPSRQSAHHR
jgi:phosphoglycolate phosphatase-like HAD superfamily hydrolase